MLPRVEGTELVHQLYQAPATCLSVFNLAFLSFSALSTEHISKLSFQTIKLEPVVSPSGTLVCRPEQLRLSLVGAQSLGCKWYSFENPCKQRCHTCVSGLIILLSHMIVKMTTTNLLSLLRQAWRPKRRPTTSHQAFSAISNLIS